MRQKKKKKRKAISSSKEISNLVVFEFWNEQVTELNALLQNLKKADVEARVPEYNFHVFNLSNCSAVFKMKRQSRQNKCNAVKVWFCLSVQCDAYGRAARGILL